MPTAAARKLIWKMRHAFAEADAPQQFARDFCPLRPRNALEREWQFDVFGSGQNADQVVILKDKTEMLEPIRRQLRLVHV